MFYERLLHFMPPITYTILYVINMKRIIVVTTLYTSIIRLSSYHVILNASIKIPNVKFNVGIGTVRNIIHRVGVIYFHIYLLYIYKESWSMKFKKISPLTSYTYCTDKSDDGGSVAVRILYYIYTLSPSFCRHFFSLSLSLSPFFQNINLAQCAV